MRTKSPQVCSRASPPRCGPSESGGQAPSGFVGRRQACFWVCWCNVESQVCLMARPKTRPPAEAGRRTRWRPPSDTGETSRTIGVASPPRLTFLLALRRRCHSHTCNLTPVVTSADLVFAEKTPDGQLKQRQEIPDPRESLEPLNVTLIPPLVCRLGGLRRRSLSRSSSILCKTLLY